jgi:hypothetical protein
MPEDSFTGSLLGPSLSMDLVEIKTFRANSAHVSSVPTIGGVLNRGIGVVNDMLLNVPGDIGR